MDAPWAMAALLWFATGASVGLPTASPSAPPAPRPVAILQADSAFGPSAGPTRQLPAASPRQADAGKGKPAGVQQSKESADDGEETIFHALGELRGFDVRIVSPAPMEAVAGRVRVRAEVAADRPAGVSAVDFFIDGRLMFSDAEAPYELLWNAGRPARHLIEVRAYGPGRQMVADTFSTGTGGLDSSLAGFAARVERVDVHALIEGGAPLDEPLDASSFEVYENDVLQPVVAVERVADLPLAVGLLIDHSGSMLDRLETALDAAGAFVEGLLTHPDDKAFVLGFADVPVVFQEFTNDTSRLADSMSLIDGGNYTALYDAIVAAAGRFRGIDGRGAVILLTDGADQGSKHRFREAIAAAQRADVAVYPVAVQLSPRFARERWILSELAKETGGRLFSLGKRSDPAQIYEAIREDLRAQIRISYAPLIPGGGGEWRELAVRLRNDEDGERRVRHRPGYFAR